MSFSAAFPYYLPDSTYFYNISRLDSLLIADHLQYVKRSPVTRSFPFNGLQLSLPTRHSGSPAPISQRELADMGLWSAKHLASIQHTCHHYPYFEEYFPYLKDIYQNEYIKLIDFLDDLLQLFLRFFHINVEIVFSSALAPSGILEDVLIEFGKSRNDDLFYLSGDSRIEAKRLQQKEIQVKIFPDLPFENESCLKTLFEKGPEAAALFRKHV